MDLYFYENIKLFKLPFTTFRTNQIKKSSISKYNKIYPFESEG